MKAIPRPVTVALPMSNGIVQAMRTWLVPLIILDFSLLPMFHIGGIPWKPGYIGLIAALLIYPKVLPKDLLRVTQPIWVASGLLLIMTLIGALVFEIQTTISPSGSTLRMMAIFALLPIAFMVGVADQKKSHGYISLVILLFFFANVVLSTLGNQAGWIIDFYSTPLLGDNETYGRGVRVPGILNNPNLTALMATLLFMYVAVGIRWKFVATGAWRVSSTLILTGFIILIMVSRNQMVAMVLVTIFALWYVPRHVAVKVISTLFVVGIIFVGMLFVLDDSKQEDIFGIKLSKTIERRWESVGFSSSQEFSSLFLTFEGVGRPVRSLPLAIDRWSDSPIIGTGFERIPGLSSIAFHNDWASILAATGLIGFITFVILVTKLGRMDILLIVPFFFPGMTNSLLFAPQHMVLVLVLAGLVAGRKWSLRKMMAENTSPTAGVISPIRVRSTVEDDSANEILARYRRRIDSRT